jgi:hypothetical protein
VQYAPRTGELPTLASTPDGVVAAIAAGLPLVLDARVVTGLVQLFESRPLSLRWCSNTTWASRVSNLAPVASWQGHLLAGAVADVYEVRGFGTIREVRATLVTPEGSREDIGGGFGNTVPNQLFDDPPTSVGEIAAREGAQIGLRSVRASTVRAIQPAVVLVATTDSPLASVNAVRQRGVVDKLLGCPRKHLEGNYLELRDSADKLVYASGEARRADAGNWFVDPSLGIDIGHGPPRTPR